MTVHIDPDLVRDVHARSGLTWRQLGLALGVSEHAVRSWANGFRFHERSQTLLVELRDEIEAIEGRLNESTPAHVRSELCATEGKVEQMRRERADRIPYGDWW